jgi:acetyl-CoA hydrolase
MAAQASALLKARVRRPTYLNKLKKAEDLIDYFPNGSYIGWSGFTGVGFVNESHAVELY